MKILVTPRLNGLNIKTNKPVEWLVRIQSSGKEHDESPVTALHVAFVIDRSGSMVGKLEEAKHCIRRAVEKMGLPDQVAIVDYDDKVDTCLPLTLVGDAKFRIKSCLDALYPRGSTALHGAWIAGAEELAKSVNDVSLSRVVLISDGMANVGLTRSEQICPQVSALAAAGVSTSTIGIGLGFNEELMVSIARAGQGRAHYGERVEDLAEAFGAELDLLKAVAYRNVTLMVPSSIDNHLELVNGYAKTDSGYQLPIIARGSEAWAVLRMPMHEALRYAITHPSFELTVNAKDENGQIIVQTVTVKFPPILSDIAYAGLVPDMLTERRCLELFAADLQMRAREEARRGDWGAAAESIAELKRHAVDHDWIQASIPFLEELIRRADIEMFSKESYNKSDAMRSRIASVSEQISFSRREESDEAYYLRRKTAQGRRSDGDEPQEAKP